MNRLVTRVAYEWDHEAYDKHGDIEDHDFSDKFPGFPADPTTKLVLVRNLAEGLSGKHFEYSCSIVDREWAYVVDGSLPEFFDGGTKVPKKFHKEIAA